MHFERSMMNLWLPEKHLRFARLPPGKNPQIQPNCSMHLMGTKSAHNHEEIRGPTEISAVIRSLIYWPQILFLNSNFLSWTLIMGHPVCKLLVRGAKQLQ